ncbi:MAG: PAS domain-containing protein, partial [Acidobacteria bacterium]|nr:PAS domain-containing protein [Acidobacteriota bacterium]
VSPAFETVWGRPAEDILADYSIWGDSIHPDDREFAFESFALIQETGGGEAREYRIVRPNGEVRWVSDRGFAIRDDEGRVVRIAGLAEDIT